jgi:transposase
MLRPVSVVKMLEKFTTEQQHSVVHFLWGKGLNAKDIHKEIVLVYGHRKRPGKLARGVLFHHDNARPHTARATQERIQELQWELLEHPPYSPDLDPSDFHLFGPLKNHLRGKSFTDDEEVETEVWKWLRQQSNHFCAAGFDALVKRQVKCINIGGGYVEK